MSGLRIVFMGTPDFACPSLAALAEAGHQVVAAVCQPDKPAGRGGRLVPPPVKVLAQARGIPVLQPRRVRHPEAVAQIRALAPDLIVTAAFGQLLSGELLAVPRLGAINVHASLLPRWRGAAPIHRAVMAGDRETGVTIMWMDEGLDTGDMLLWRAVPIGPDDTTGDLHDRLAALGAELVVEAVRLIAAGQAPRIPQDHSRATYAAKLTRADEWIAWQEPAEQVKNRVRGLNPWPGAYTTLRDGTVLKVWRVQVVPVPAVPGAPTAPGVGAAPGTILGVIKGQGPVVACGQGAVVLLEVQPAGRRRMDGMAFAAGYRPQPGEVLGATGAPGEEG